MTKSVSIITMPWGQPIYPNLLMGNLHSIIESEYQTTSYSYHLEFLKFIHSHGYHIRDYQAMIGCFGLGDFIFAIPPLKEANNIDDTHYCNYLASKGVQKNVIDMAFEFRKLAVDFLNSVSKELNGNDFLIFCPMYRELTPSLVLAKKIKQVHRDVKILFASDVLDGDISSILISEYKFIDFVVSSDPEEKILSVLAGAENFITEDIPTALESNRCNAVSLDFLKTPNYDDFFSRLKRSKLYSEILPKTWLPYEYSRGCWWAEKSKCAFCALTKSNSTYREKEIDSAVNGMIELSKKYRVLNFQFFDWTVPKSKKTFNKLFTKIKEQNCNFTIYLQSKTNISKLQLLLLKNIGSVIQFGIESLDTSELKRIKKGSTVFQNIRALKWCAELNIRSEWNILYGFPNERSSKYRRLSNVLPSLYHLWPPSFNRFRFQKMSPFFDNSLSYNIKKNGPLKWYKYIYSNLSSSKLKLIAEEFDYKKSEDYLEYESFEKVKKQVTIWNKNSEFSYQKLIYLCGPNFITIVDLRYSDGRREYYLNLLESIIYLLCDSEKSLEKIYSIISEEYKYKIDMAEVNSFLQRMVGCRLMYSEENIFLSLAIADDFIVAEKMLIKYLPSAQISNIFTS